jgi:hypothetical protein
MLKFGTEEMMEYAATIHISEYAGNSNHAIYAQHHLTAVGVQELKPVNQG